MGRAGAFSRRTWLAAGVVAPVITWSAALAQSPPASPCATATEEDRIQVVLEDGEIRLERLGAIRLADIRLIETQDTARPLAWLRSLSGRRVQVAAGRSDRWQRRRAVLALADEVAPIDIGELLVGEGFAIVDAGEEDALCRPALLELEQRARERRLGAWRADSAPLLRGDDTRLADQIGRFAIVEGRILSVGERATRTYLNFGRAGTGALTVTLPKRTWSILRGRGLSADGLRGRRVRARGMIEMWRAPTIEIVAADVLEILDGKPGPRAGATPDAQRP
jgi:endonuclease YncB( thermonuclease family)